MERKVLHQYLSDLVERFELFNEQNHDNMADLTLNFTRRVQWMVGYFGFWILDMGRYPVDS